jgi:6-phosphofructokinase 2
MIATLTLNPALDKSTEIDRLIPENKMRCPALDIEAGGGGINISKAIRELGGESVAIFPYGGLNGQLLLDILSEKSIATKGVKVNETTRENFTINEIATNRQYRFVMPGPSLSDQDLISLASALKSVSGATYLVVSGSLPAGHPTDFIMKRIGEIAKEKEIRLIIDTSGDSLKAALDTGVYLLKPNLSELCSLVGRESLEMSEIDDAAYEVINTRHCEVIVVSMGPSGAILFE